jgi:hypothetical protein
MAPKELLRRMGMTSYQAETTKITQVAIVDNNVKVSTTRTVKHQPGKGKGVDDR